MACVLISDTPYLKLTDILHETVDDVHSFYYTGHMPITGQNFKMKTQLGSPISYSLVLGDQLINMTEKLGQTITLTWTGDIQCIGCGRQTNKSFMQGYCYPCFLNSPQTAECIIRPELCEAHLGKGRDPEWEEAHHNQPHVVYLALSSGVKVGVTRDTQIPTRWIDQGASKTLVLAETPNRYLAGCIEVALKPFVADKTPWQRMLKNEIGTEDLHDYKTLLAEKLPIDLQEYISNDASILELNYPALGYPEKVKSLNFDKTPEISGVLMGIKGQYLIFEEGLVLNMRKFGGYMLTFGQ